MKDQKVRKSYELPKMACLAILVFLESSFAPSALGQAEPATASESQRLWNLVISLESQLHKLLTMAPSPPPLDGIESCEVESPSTYLAAALRREANARDADNGLRINGFYTSEDIVDEDGKDGRGFLELSWDLLEQGVRGNEREAEILRHKADLEEILASESTSRQRLRCQRDQIHQLFAPLQLDVRSLQLRLLEPIYEYERRAYFKGWSYLDELLVSERDLLLVRRELEYLADIVRDTAAVMPPTIDVNMPELLAAIDTDGRFARARALNDSLTRAQYEAQQRQRLRLFLRQEVDGAGNLEDVVAGLRFSVPIGAPKTLALDERLRYNEARSSLASWERTAIVRSAYIEVREQLERVIKSQYAVERSAERLRRSIAEYRLTGEASLPVALERLKSQLSAVDELLSAKEVLYRRIGELMVHARLPYREAFVEYVPLESPQRARSGNRALYLWSADFNGRDNRLLLDLAATRGISRLSVSLGAETDRQKLRALLDAPRRPEVEILLGDASWLREDKRDGAMERILLVLEEFPDLALHLDLEPQQLDEYDRDREAVLDDYLEFLRELRIRIPRETALRLSVPLRWPPALYRELAGLSDELSVMAYGLDGDAMLEHAMAMGSVVPARKLRWTLRAADYPDEWLLEEQIRELTRETELSRFAVHGADQWLMAGEVSRETP